MTTQTQETRLQRTNNDITHAIESLRNDLSQLDRELQRAMTGCTEALTGAEFKLNPLGVVQNSAARIDAACAAVHELIKRRNQLNSLAEQD